MITSSKFAGPEAHLARTLEDTIDVCHPRAEIYRPAHFRVRHQLANVCEQNGMGWRLEDDDEPPEV
jgi:hypothetical protein